MPIRELAEVTKPFLSLGNQYGEGWFLTGEMVELLQSGTPNIVCIQPFACLPNHVVGKGVIKVLKKHYPQANIAAVDYDPGASEVNQLNRIKLMLSAAKKAVQTARGIINRQRQLKFQFREERRAMAKERKKDRIKRVFYKNKTTLSVYLFLRALIILAMIRAIFLREYQSVFLCALSLFLMILPSIISKRLEIELPSTLEIIILLFIFAAEILGELSSFYIRVAHWDTMLHTINGFLCAAIGFALVDMMNRSERFSFQLSPVYLAIVAFCFSMTVGVLWEFFEFSGDCLLGSGYAEGYGGQRHQYGRAGRDSEKPGCAHQGHYGCDCGPF